MTTLTIEQSKLVKGVWEALLIGPKEVTPPAFVARHLGNPLDGLELIPGASEGFWILRLPVPVEILSDGVQTVVIEHADDGEVLGSFAIISGESGSFDVRAELDLLRAEVDMLKQIVRRALRK